MPRPRKCRTVQAHPEVTLFKPQGVPAWRLAEVTLPVEGLEALRLADLEGADHESAASGMGVSRPTFSRILAAARFVVAEALVRGLALRVEGGDFIIEEPPFPPGPGRGGRWRHGRGGRGPGGQGPP